jgi:hypothetical protein
MDWGILLRHTNHPSYPLIRQIVADLQRDYAEWCDKVHAFELINSTATHRPDEAEALEREVQALAVDIESYIAEINYLGIEFDAKQLFEDTL